MNNTDKIKVDKELLKVVKKHEDEFKRSGVANVYQIKWEIERLGKEEEFVIPLTRAGDGHFSVEFTPDKTKTAHETLWEIYSTHKAVVKDELKEKRKAELLRELKRLEEMGC